MILFLSLAFIAGTCFIWFVFLIVTGLINKNKTRIWMSSVALIFTIILSSWSVFLLLSVSFRHPTLLLPGQDLQRQFAPDVKKTRPITALSFFAFIGQADDTTFTNNRK